MESDTVKLGRTKMSKEPNFKLIGTDLGITRSPKKEKTRNKPEMFEEIIKVSEISSTY